MNNFKKSVRISRFEFKVQDSDGKEFWTEIQGSGGQFGNECKSCLFSPQFITLVLKKVLNDVRRELKSEGNVRIWKGDDLPPAERIVKVNAQKIIAGRCLTSDEKSYLSK